MGDLKGDPPWGIDYINATQVPNRNASGILVALLDGGMEVGNPVFEGNLWSSSQSFNHIDLGFTGAENTDQSLFGIDFTDPSNLKPNPVPDEIEPSHATQVASIIGGRPVSDHWHGGVTHSIKMMPLKVQPPHQGCAVESIVQAVSFAIKQRVHILNCSFIQYGQDPRIDSVFRKAIAAGMLVVAAAGNDDANLENHPGYPANIDSDSVLTVGAIQSDIIDHLSPCSNFGSLVNIAAPGDGGLYIGPHKRLKHPPGKTSFAAAHVSGAAALVWSQIMDKGLSRLEQVKRVKELILKGARYTCPVKETGDFELQVKTWGVGNPILDLSFLIPKQ